jgi:hypothetical protein
VLANDAAEHLRPPLGEQAQRLGKALLAGNRLGHPLAQPGRGNAGQLAAVVMLVRHR